MNKAEFLNELSFCLHSMNDSEKNKFIIYYDEMISDYVENGIGLCRKWYEWRRCRE